MQAGDRLFFHFSGHGSTIPDDDGDEVSGLDQCLVPLDAARPIRDDELNARLIMRLSRLAV